MPQVPEAPGCFTGARGGKEKDRPGVNYRRVTCPDFARLSPSLFPFPQTWNFNVPLLQSYAHIPDLLWDCLSLKALVLMYVLQISRSTYNLLYTGFVGTSLVLGLDVGQAMQVLMCYRCNRLSNPVMQASTERGICLYITYLTGHQ